MNFALKRNDTKTALKATLKKSDGNAVDLTQSTVRFIAEKKGVKTIDRSATILDYPNGIVQFEFQSTEISQSGSLKAEFEVTYPDGKIETFPNSEYIIIDIKDDLG